MLVSSRSGEANCLCIAIREVLIAKSAEIVGTVSGVSMPVVGRIFSPIGLAGAFGCTNGDR
uniref:Uncharacterized protein n=1 Tax=Desertifilum tharense IPPAS B-1220 TaxID=1781255 RepID=A0ACD5H1Z8_9CYAN